MQRAQEIRKLYKQTILDSVYMVGSIIPTESIDGFYAAREEYRKGKSQFQILFEAKL